MANFYLDTAHCPPHRPGVEDLFYYSEFLNHEPWSYIAHAMERAFKEASRNRFLDGGRKLRGEWCGRLGCGPIWRPYPESLPDCRISWPPQPEPPNHCGRPRTYERLPCDQDILSGRTRMAEWKDGEDPPGGWYEPAPGKEPPATEPPGSSLAGNRKWNICWRRPGEEPEPPETPSKAQGGTT